MKLISFDASKRQLSKLRNGLPVRIKKGSGFNLVVHPENYNIVHRAFRNNRGVQLKLTPEEIETNETLSPEEHEELSADVDENLFNALPFMEGGSIFKKAKKGLKSKGAIKLGRELQPLSRELKSVGREMAHEKIAEAHQDYADRYGDDERSARLINTMANYSHQKVGNGIGKKLKKIFSSKTAKKIGRELKPLTRALKSTAKELLHEKIAEAHMAGADRYGDDPRASRLMNIGAEIGHRNVGNGLYAGRGLSSHEALRLANLATASANHQLAKIHNAIVHGQIAQPPIKRYWDEPDAPPSRGTGMTNHYNLIRGRGSMINQDYILPPALQSQPYGANFHLQYQLPPQYRKFNDGGEVLGRGMYA